MHMTKSYNDKQPIKKVNAYVQKRLPECTSRYFKANIGVKSPRTLYEYAVDLADFFKYLESSSFDVNKMTISDLDMITPEIIENYMEYSREYRVNNEVKTRSNEALRHRLCAISSFFEYYSRYEMISRNPASKIKPPSVKKEVEIPSTDKTENDIVGFIFNGSLDGRRRAFQKRTGIRDAAIVAVFASSGIKVSDLVNLNIEDVHLDELYITLNRRKRHKKVYISTSAAQILGQYLSQRLGIIADHDHDTALFLSLRCKRMCIRSVQYMIKKYSNAVLGNGEHLTPEAIHRSFRNKIFIQSGNNIPMTSEICGISQATLYQYYGPYLND